ncbi:MAG: metal-dependent transcriptional regulator [Enterocloster sp.]
MHGNESSEDYLETILVLSKRLPVVRSIDIATELNYSKPSVSIAMKNLREKGHIEVNPSGFITLTESGLRIASSIYERHTFISNWLISLGVSEKTALADACNMEHQISEESFNAMKHFIETHHSQELS